MFIDFLNLVFFIVVVGLSIIYFIAGDNFENFKILMQSLAPFGFFGLLFLIVLRVNRGKVKKRLAEGNSETTLRLSFMDRTKADIFVFSLPLTVSAVAWLINGQVAIADFFAACAVFLLAYFFRWWLFSKEEI